MSIVLDDLTAQLDTLTKAVLSQPLAHRLLQGDHPPAVAAWQGVFSA